MSSKNPINNLASKIALDGGYDPCSKFSGYEKFWNEINECEPGFIPDYANGYCYKILPTFETLNDGKKKCEYENNAEIVLFNSNSEVSEFINLILGGIPFINIFFY